VALKLRGASQEAMQKTILTLLHGWREVRGSLTLEGNADYLVLGLCALNIG
jgi:hypothetical protein